ncbi:outer membrane lipoprotein-sorting protein [bacterium]|nr:outer membrane lipoprotein-sorting protein [bacterium]
MRTFRIFFLSLLCMPVCVSAADMTAKEVMKEMEQRHQVTSEASENVMLLVDRRGNKETRTVKSFYKDLGDGESRLLFVFIDPAAVKGVSMLTWNHEGRENDQWLYLPSQGKMRRVAQSSKKSYFLGTDITFEDMEPEEMDNFNYTMLDAETVDGHDCFVIEAVLADQAKLKASGYSKRKLWIRKDIFFVVKTEYYDRGGRLLKTQTSHDLFNVEGTIWRAKKTLIDNHKKNHKTLTGIKSSEINLSIDEQVFTERYITSGKHIQ